MSKAKSPFKDGPCADAKIRVGEQRRAARPSCVQAVPRVDALVPFTGHHYRLLFYGVAGHRERKSP